MEKESWGNSTFNFVRTVLLSLCANYNEHYQLPENWTCEFRSEYFYSLKSLKGKLFKFTTLQRLPLSGAVVDENGQLRGTGIAFDLIHEIQEKVGFYYNITLPKENVVGDEKEGIIQLLKNKEVDMAVAFIPMTQLFRELVSFSSALAEFEWVLFMARPSASASGSGLLAPFQETTTKFTFCGINNLHLIMRTFQVWFFILASLIIAGPVMYFITYMRMRFSNEDISTRKAYPLSTCFWFVYGALMKQGSTLNPVYDSSRLFFATWWIFITILTSFYTANLTAFLTLSQFTLTIQTTRDIYVHHKHWMADKGGYEETLITVSIRYVTTMILSFLLLMLRFSNYEVDSRLRFALGHPLKVKGEPIFLALKAQTQSDNAFDYLKETIPRYGQFISEPLDQRLQRIMKGDIYVTEKRHAEVIMMRDYLNKTFNQVQESKRCSFVLTPKSVLARPVGFAYQKDSELKLLFDPMLAYLKGGGIITHLLDRDQPITAICPLNLANRERKLLNSDLATTYKTVAVGFGSALTAFIGEVIFRYIKNRGNKKKIARQYPDTSQIPKPLNNLLLVNEYKSESNLHDNLIMSQYYNEINPFKYNGLKDNIFQDRQNGLIIPPKKSENILFQYIH